MRLTSPPLRGRSGVSQGALGTGEPESEPRELEEVSERAGPNAVHHAEDEQGREDHAVQGAEPLGTLCEVRQPGPVGHADTARPPPPEGAAEDGEVARAVSVNTAFSVVVRLVW